MGAATEGGYLGNDVQSFLSAVISGAAGFYAVTVTEDAGIGTDLTIQPGQNVQISGDPSLVQAPSWGSGGVVVGERGSLALARVMIGALVVHTGGNATVSGGSLSKIGVEPGGALKLHEVLWQRQSVTLVATQNLQCYQSYTTLSDSWRSTSNGEGVHCDCARAIAVAGAGGGVGGTGVGGGGWYRFGGSGGDALPLTPQGIHHCGTDRTGWLSGWDAGGGVAAPPGSYGSAGRYPAAAEGVAEMTACFDNSNTGNTGAQCLYHAAVGVVRCEGFLLWRLQSLQPSCTSFCGGCTLGYCTAPSGL